MKKFALLVGLLAFAALVVSAHSYHDKKPSKENTVSVSYEKADAPDVYLADACFPEVAINPLVHIQRVVVLAKGFTPVKEAKARAPTINWLKSYNRGNRVRDGD